MAMRVERLVDDPIWRHRGNPQFSEHDSFGFRSEVKMGDAKFLLLGSSHVYGTNLAHHNSWPIILQRSGLPIYNASMGAWSAMQFALAAQAWVTPQIEKLLVCVYLGFDVYASLKQSVEVGAHRRFSFLNESDGKFGIDWRYRHLRDLAIGKAREDGCQLLEALRLAHFQGHSDCVPVWVDNTEWWIEPRLRLNSTDLSIPYIARAFEVCEAYLKTIDEVCNSASVKWELCLLPTKEATVLSRAGASQIAGLESSKLIASERRLAQQLVQFASARGILCSDLWDLYIESELMDIFDPVPLEGHPGISGAERIGQWIACHHFPD
jgi:hypothetical protein